MMEDEWEQDQQHFLNNTAGVATTAVDGDANRKKGKRKDKESKGQKGKGRTTVEMQKMEDRQLAMSQTARE